MKQRKASTSMAREGGGSDFTSSGTMPFSEPTSAAMRPDKSRSMRSAPALPSGSRKTPLHLTTSCGKLVSETATTRAPDRSATRPDST